MKNKLWIIALTAIIGFSFAACGDGSGNNNGGTETGTAPTITTNSLPNGTVNTAYSQTLEATGDAPITWSIASGTLPTGLTLNATTGIIAGTPTTATSAAFTVKAENAAGSGTKQLSITIATVDGKTPPSISTTSFPNGTVNTAYSQTLEATGDAPITWSIASGTLPDGLTLSAAGIISGTPTTAGTSPFTVRASNVAGSDTKPLSITIAKIDYIATSVADFKTWLDAQPANAAATAYNVKLNVSDLGGTTNTNGSAGYILKNSTKYVSLDLSGSTFTSLPYAGSYGSFSGCDSLTGIILPSSITSIGDSAFYMCSNLTSVTIPDSVTSIEGAFSFCTSLASVTIPNSVTSLRGTFIGCRNLTSITIPDSVTSIGYSTFSSCSSLTSIDISASVTSIGSMAFSFCTSLTSIDIPDSVTSIGEQTFEGCTSLTSITIPNSVTSIGQYAFKGCTGLTGITIGNSVTSIDDYAFLDCTSLTSVTIPNSVTSLRGIFIDCTSLASVTIPNSVTSLYGTFNGCTSLTSVIIPNSVTSIGTAAFANSGLTSLTIPDSVTSIGDRAFLNCLSLASITIPKNVTTIGIQAFASNTIGISSHLATITVDDGNTAYSSQDGVLYDKDKTTLIQYPAGKAETAFTIPNSVTSIGSSAFSGCIGLTGVTILNSVISIGDFAFNYCTSLTSVTIPNSVISIGSGAFSGCTKLISVTFATGSNIPNANFGNYAFPEGSYGSGENTLKTAYNAASTKAGTYTRAANGSTWTKS